MKFLYKSYLAIPEIIKPKDDKSETEAVHCHSHGLDFNYRIYKSYKPSDRKWLRSSIDKHIKQIQVCLTFFNKYKNSVTSPEESAAIAAAIKSDELEIEVLLREKPSCTIL